MLRERSSSTTSEAERPARACSSTGWASSHASTSSAPARSHGSARLARAGSGGTANP
jgi:hypothetical protein